MTTWRLDVLMEVKPFTDCYETAKKKRGWSDGVVSATLGRFREQADRIGTFTTAHMCTVRTLVPQDDFVWFLASNSSHRSTGRKSSGTNSHCAFSCGQSKAEEKSCVVVWSPCSMATAWTSVWFSWRSGFLPPPSPPLLLES